MSHLMLYATHRSSCFHFPTASSVPGSLRSPSVALSSSSSGMECVDAALKTSFRKEMAVKASPQVLYEDIWVQNGVSCDDFFVDELLDFSNGEGFGVEETVAEEEEVEEEKPCGATVSSPILDVKSTDFAAEDDVASSVPATELSVPADDVVSLEWVSHFVEDSNSEYCAPFSAGASPAEPNTSSFSEPEKPKQMAVLTEHCFKTPVPGKARSKRTRTRLRVWHLLGSPSVTESSSSSTITSSSSSHSSPWLIYTNSGMNDDPSEPVCFEEWQQPTKKPKKKRPAVEVAPNSGGGSQPPRRCSHCGVQRTPQWRTGPLGAKTLCNACGVRYKSGRLLPEYRPACSPTFSSELHSNHHRKVLEMRKRKETFGHSESGLAPLIVPSFG